MKALIIAVVTLLALSLVAERISAHPDPDCSDTPSVITISPDGSIPYTVVVKQVVSSCVALGGSLVEIEFSPEADALIAWAPGQAHPLIYTITDINGEATFYIAGGGCVDPTRFSSSIIATVRADGVLLAEPMVNSVDAVNSWGLLPTEAGASICENAQTTVGLSDAVFHTSSIRNALQEPCSKFSEPFDQPVSLEDAVFISPFVKTGVFSNCD